MSLLTGLGGRLRQWVNRPAAEDRLNEEVRFQLDMETEKNIELGMEPHVARRQATLAFGGVESHKEEVRDAHKIPWIEDLWREVRFGARSLRRSPWLTAVIIGTLAAGIGTSVMIEAAGRALITNAVPFFKADELVNVSGVQRGSGSPSYNQLRVWQEAAEGLSTLSGYTSGYRAIGTGAQTTRVFGSRATEGYVRILGVDPVIGRTFIENDFARGSAPVTVINERLWRRSFNADPAIEGKSIRIDGDIHTIVGVIPTSMQFPAGSDIWTPLQSSVEDNPSIRVIGRLMSGTSRTELEAALSAVQSGLDTDLPPDERFGGIDIQSLGELNESDRTGFVVLQIAVLVLILLASANAGGMMHTRAIERRQEIAVRASLGAGRARIARGLMVESCVLALPAGLLAFAFAWGGIRLLHSLLPPMLTRNMLGWEGFALDFHSAAFAFVLTIVTGIAFGIFPALSAVKGDLTVHLREGAPTTTGGRRVGIAGRVILAGEVALALTMLLTAGLLTRSLIGLMQTDPGFQSDQVLTMEWSLPPDRYASDEQTSGAQQLILQRVRSVPGVVSVGLVSNLPMSRTGWSRPYLPVDAASDLEEQSASWRPITHGYLEALGVRLLRGRPIVSVDRAGATRVAIISEALAERHWEGNPIGERLEVESESWTVIGVAENVHEYGVDRTAEPTIYVPQAQTPTTSGFLAVRATGNPATLARAVRQ